MGNSGIMNQVAYIPIDTEISRVGTNNTNGTNNAIRVFN
jgi:hypothetical protein